jgi:hypothetical protein
MMHVFSETRFTILYMNLYFSQISFHFFQFTTWIPFLMYNDESSFIHSYKMLHEIRWILFQTINCSHMNSVAL